MISSSVTAIIPAVDEPDVDKTITSLLYQECPPDKIFIVVNNTDSNTTYESAMKVNSSVVEVVNVGFIDGKKAGAINSVLPQVSTEYVLIMDADTVMHGSFISTALEHLRTGEFGAVGGIFTAPNPKGFLQWCQSIEYSRYAVEVERKHRVMVLTGTASIISMEALRAVKEARESGSIPGTGWYDINSITEDGEMSIALKSLGYLLASPKECLTSTELMGTWKDLRKQRIRWYRGALDNLREYGLTPVTRRYWMQQAALTIGVVTFLLYLLVTAVYLLGGSLTLSPIWAMVGVAFSAERVWTARNSGKKGIILAGLVVPELVYSTVLQYSYIKAAIASFSNSQLEWHQADGIRSTSKGVNFV